MSETPPAPPAPPAPISPAPTMKALENLEARVALLESTVKDQALKIAQLLVPPPVAAPTKKAGLLKDRK